MNIQLDLTTTMPSQNFDSAQGYITLQNHRVVDVDNDVAQIFGFSTREALLENVSFAYALVPEHYQGTVKKRYLEAMKGQIQKGKVYTDIKTNGRTLSLFSLAHLTSFNNKPALQVHLIDITLVVEAERKRHENDRMYRRLLNTSKQGILIHRNFKPLMVNQTWVDQQGAESVEQVLAMDSIISIVPQAQRMTAITRCHNILNGKPPSFSSIVENCCFDGTNKHFTIYDNVIHWEGEDAIQVVLEDVTDKVALEKELIHRAMHDDLTQVFNRRAIYDWLKRPSNMHVDMSCLLIDIDNFKQINDRYGHSIGDNVIKNLADTIKIHVEALNGVVGRWGGEEFIVFIPKASDLLISKSNTKESQSKKLGEQICQDFNQHVFLGLGRRQFTSSASIGITERCILGSTDSIDTLIRLTDNALYRAKANGKNCVVINPKCSCLKSEN